MRWNVRHRHRMNVADGRFAEIRRIGLLRVFVPIRRKDAFAAGFFKCEAEPADAAEQINETKFVVRAIAIDVIRRRVLVQGGGFGLAALLFH